MIWVVLNLGLQQLTWLFFRWVPSPAPRLCCVVCSANQQKLAFFFFPLLVWNKAYKETEDIVNIYFLTRILNIETRLSFELFDVFSWALLAHFLFPQSSSSLAAFGFFCTYLPKLTLSEYVLRRTTCCWCWAEPKKQLLQRSRRPHGPCCRRPGQLPVVKQCKTEKE